MDHLDHLDHLSHQSNEHHTTGNTNRFVARAMSAAVEHDVLVIAGIAGVHGVLAFLNARTRYRYSGIWPIAGAPHARSFVAHLYDRELPIAEDPDHRMLEQVIGGLGSMQETNPRGAGPLISTGGAVSAFGALLLSRDGSVRGALCHFDTRLRTDPSHERAVLAYLGGRSEQWLPASGGPADQSPPVAPGD